MKGERDAFGITGWRNYTTHVLCNCRKMRSSCSSFSGRGSKSEERSRLYII